MGRKSKRRPAPRANPFGAPVLRSRDGAWFVVSVSVGLGPDGVPTRSRAWYPARPIDGAGRLVDGAPLSEARGGVYLMPGGEHGVRVAPNATPAHFEEQPLPPPRGDGWEWRVLRWRRFNAKGRIEERDPDLAWLESKKKKPTRPNPRARANPCTRARCSSTPTPGRFDARRSWPWLKRPRPNPPADEIQLPAVWLPLRRDGKWNGAIRETLEGHAGVYAVREPRNPSTVLYVGESHVGGMEGADYPGQFWKQIRRHFSRHEPTDGTTRIWTHLRPGDLDVALWLTPPDRSFCVEGRMISELEPLHAKKRDYSDCLEADEVELDAAPF